MVLKKMSGFRLHYRTIEILGHLQSINGLDATKQIERLIEAEARILSKSDPEMKMILAKSARDYADEVAAGLWIPKEKNKGRGPSVKPGSRT